LINCARGILVNLNDILLLLCLLNCFGYYDRGKYGGSCFGVTLINKLEKLSWKKNGKKSVPEVDKILQKIELILIQV